MKRVLAKDVGIGLWLARSDVVTARWEAEHVVQRQDGKTRDVSDLSHVMWSLSCVVNVPSYSKQTAREETSFSSPSILPWDFLFLFDPWYHLPSGCRGGRKSAQWRCLGKNVLTWVIGMIHRDTEGFREACKTSYVFKVLVAFQSVSGINWGEGERKGVSPKGALPNVICCNLNCFNKIL